MELHVIPNVCSEYSEHYLRDCLRGICKKYLPLSHDSLIFSYLHMGWQFGRIFRRSPLSEENYPNRNPAWKQALLILIFKEIQEKVLVPLSPPLL
jgi:hypothetical protein